MSLEPHSTRNQGTNKTTIKPWVFAYQLSHDCPIVFDSSLRTSELDCSAMSIAGHHFRSLTTHGMRFLAGFGSVEVGEGVVMQVRLSNNDSYRVGQAINYLVKIIGPNQTSPLALDIWVSSYTPNDYLTAAFYRPKLLTKVVGARDKHQHNLSVGSKVVLIKLKIDRRLKMAGWIVLVSLLLLTACLVIGFVIKQSDLTINIFMAYLSFVGAIIASLNWVSAS